MSIPKLTVKACSNFDAGYEIGRKYKRLFAASFQQIPFKTLWSFYESDEGRKVFERCIEATEQCYPQILDELRGMAEGSGLPEENFLLHSMASEIWLYYKPDGYDAEISRAAGERCTDVLVNTEECRMVAHNEDWLRECAGKCFMVDMTINKQESGYNSNEDYDDDDENDYDDTDIFTKISNRNERFVAFMTPCDLAGLTFGMNRHFVITVNSQFPDSAYEGGVPVGVLLRALLACETIEECVEVMKNEPFGCCYGINVNIASIHSTDMWSLEVYTDEDGSRAKLTPLPYQSEGMQRKQYVHANHLKYIDNIRQEDYPHSVDRERVAQKHPTPTGLEGLCNIMGDYSHKNHPIYRRVGSEASATLATAMFDIDSKKMLVYNKNPKASPPHLVIPFLH